MTLPSGMRFDYDRVPQITHYVRSIREIPPCGDPGGHMTTAFWDVTCVQCLHSLPLALDQFRQARRDLWAALKLSLHSRHSGNGS